MPRVQGGNIGRRQACRHPFSTELFPDFWGLDQDIVSARCHVIAACASIWWTIVALESQSKHGRAADLLKDRVLDFPST
jgi:hypothetical protein